MGSVDGDWIFMSLLEWMHYFLFVFDVRSATTAKLAWPIKRWQKDKSEKWRNISIRGLKSGTSSNITEFQRNY
jgi:hypothetical protein